MSVHKPPNPSSASSSKTRSERTAEALAETRASLDRTAVVQAKKVFRELVERAPGNTFKRPVQQVHSKNHLLERTTR
jgi:hypothetical protein